MFKPASLLLVSCGVIAAAPCRVEIIDKENGWPVPLVELRSTHEARHVSDNLGLIAIDDPELLELDVWFHVKGHGYGVPKDGFGYEGVRTTLKAGGTFRINVERRNIAKRIGRLTGAGLFAEAEKLGIAPLLPDTGVFGCDSVLTTRHDGKLFSLWGDTTLPGYPLGVFNSTAATTPLDPLKKFEPPLAMPYNYFRDEKNKPRGVAVIPGEGPTWLTGMISLPCNHLVATYSKIKGFLDEYEVGLCVWDPASNKFVPEKVIWKKADGEKPLLLKGHPVRWKDAAGKSWLLFGDPFPDARCPDDFESWKNPATWEKIPAPNAPRSAADGSEVKPHRGSIAWNAFRKRWIAIFTQNLGKPSAFGEIWYAEADSPLGQWVGTVKVLSHDNYTFYNPRIQTDLTSEGASFILFEGTYTAEFADHAQPTTRYNYNQILYRLDLDDPKLKGGNDR
jgi:hypothetical protein